MWFHLIPVYLSAVIASSYGFWVHNDPPACPPKEELKPCTCLASVEVTAVCRNVIDGVAVKDVFSKNPNWNIQKIHFDRCTMNYVPSSIARYKNLKTLNVSSSNLAALFDEPLGKSPEVDIYLYDLRISRGIEWELFKNSSVNGLGTFNMPIRNIGRDFKEHMTPEIKNLWFENSKTTHITDQAFQRLEKLILLTITGGNLKTLSRDWFPRPWKVKFLNFSKQKITILPKDMFEDLPELVVFAMLSNYLKTIDEKVFTRSATSYSLGRNPIYCNCDVKWITTAGRQSGKIFFGTCDGPESFKGKKVNSLTEKDFSFCR